MSHHHLRVFVSSRMQELAPERQAVEVALEALGVDAWLFETDAGARPESIEQVFLEEVAAADLFEGLFWKGYGAYTIDEFEHAQALGKPCFLYVKRTDLDGQRDPKLQAFLDRITRVETGLTIGWFDTPDELNALVKRDVARELAKAYRRHRENRLAHTLPAAVTEERRNLLILLDKVKQTWVEGVLEHATAEKVLLDLDKAMRPEAVARPWEEVLAGEEPTPRAVPPGTKIIDLFEASGRALLILGAPGSGKTIALLDLAHALLVRAEHDPTLPIPVVFNLSAWSDTDQELAHWLTAELSDKYRIPKKMGRSWLDARRLLLLLDGLDEVRSEKRAACVEAINAFARESLHGLVVCSRLEPYEALRPTRLELDRAVCLQPLTTGQVDAYLTGAAADLEALRTALASDPALQALAETPLMLNIMSEVYQDAPAEALSTPEPSTTEDHRHLFETYVARMFKRRGAAASFSREQITAWLAWMAQGMGRHAQSVFLVEQLQPSWLTTRGQHWAYALGTRLTGLSMMGLILGLFPGLFVWKNASVTPPELILIIKGGLVVGLVGGLVIGLMRGLYVGLRMSEPRLRRDIKTVEKLSWSWKDARRRGILGFLAGLLLGSALDLISGLNPAEKIDIIAWLVSGLLVGLIAALYFGTMGLLFGGLRTSVIDTKMTPNEGITLTIRNAVLAGLRYGMSAWLTLGLTLGLTEGLISVIEIGFFARLVSGLLEGAWILPVGLLASLFYGGADVIKHYALRLLLVRNGVIPRNYVRFLDEAARLIFLQKVGGGYIFIHRLLLEHFAALRPSQDRPEALPSEKPDLT